MPRLPGALICFSSGFVKKDVVCSIAFVPCICLRFCHGRAAHLNWEHACVCMCLCVYVCFLLQESKWLKFSFPQKTHTYVFCASQLLQGHKVGLTAVIYLAGYPAFLQRRCQEKTKSWLSQKDLAMFFFPLQLPPGLAWTLGPRICSKHTGEAWAFPGLCFG